MRTVPLKTVTVTIGRNVGREPLPADRWNQFIADTRRYVDDVTDELWVATPYKGSWDEIPEDAFVFYGPLKGDRDAWVNALRERLSILAAYYGQQAIGISVGISELVEALDTAFSEGVTA